jgi:hypothetical protein
MEWSLTVVSCSHRMSHPISPSCIINSITTKHEQSASNRKRSLQKRGYRVLTPPSPCGLRQGPTDPLKVNGCRSGTEISSMSSSFHRSPTPQKKRGFVAREHFLIRFLHLVPLALSSAANPASDCLETFDSRQRIRRKMKQRNERKPEGKPRKFDGSRTNIGISKFSTNSLTTFCGPFAMI